MTESDRNDKREIDDIVRHSADRAEILFPRRTIGWKARIALIITALIIVINSIFTVVDTTLYSQTNACQKSQSKTLTALRSSNQAATTAWINDISDKIKAKKLTADDIETLRKQYNQTLVANNTQIDHIAASKCK